MSEDGPPELAPGSGRRSPHRAAPQARGFAEAGHFYSPIGDPREVRAYYRSDHYRMQCERVDAMLDHDAMLRLWPLISAGMVAFPMQPAEGFRYHGLNNQMPYFDASILSGLIVHLDPGRIIEIGAGWSSAAIFDTVARMPAPRLAEFTTIDPDLRRVRALSPPPQARLVAAPVQSLGLARFQALAAGDLLFVDSSHVLKTGSDVHFEYLHILPVLAPGVIVHIHDIHYPLEYPRGWAVRENRSWNEVYLVDMMLTHSWDWEVLFFNDAFLRREAGRLEAAGEAMFARFAAVPTRPANRMAGSLWLRRRG